MQCRMLSSFSGLYPLNTSSTAPPSYDSQKRLQTFLMSHRGMGRGMGGGRGSLPRWRTICLGLEQSAILPDFWAAVVKEDFLLWKRDGKTH